MRLAATCLGLLLTGPAVADPAGDAVALLRRSCVECHGPDKQKGGLRLDSRAGLLKGGENGPPVVPGKPDRSELIRRVTLAKGIDGVMPARGEPLSRDQVETLR